MTKYIVSHRSGCELCKTIICNSYEEADEYVVNQLLSFTDDYLANEYGTDSKKYRDFSKLSKEKRLAYAEDMDLICDCAFIGYNDWEEFDISEHEIEIVPNKDNEPLILTVGLLRELIGDKNIPQLQKIIESHKNEDYLDLINRDDYVASVLWSKEDIASQMAEMGITPTEENIAKVINSGNLKRLNECSDQDWYVIKYAIEEALELESERD